MILTPPLYDTVVCNPPFHEKHTITDEIANRMITQSANILKKDGRLFLIGNRHLKYHITLKKFFKSVKPLANNNKFVLFEAIK